ncbi:MAG: rod shape-determining protein MreC [Dongiaceae bacterium]
MKQRLGPMLRVGSPLKSWFQRGTFLLLVAASLTLMMLGKSEAPWVEKARTMVADVTAPVLALLTEPVTATERLFANLEELVDLRADNARLKAERERLLEWQRTAIRLEAENRALSQLLNLAPDPHVSYVTARVVGDQVGAFVREMLVAAGTRDGIRKGQAAMTGDGLAGRVADVGQRSARVLLLTDINSRIPVLVERTRDRAILAGDNSNRPQLLYLKPQNEVVVGDRIVTSSDGGVFPAGLPVGIVDRVEEGVVSIAPFVDWDRLEYLRVVDYALTGILGDMPSDGVAEGSEARTR